MKNNRMEPQDFSTIEEAEKHVDFFDSVMRTKICPLTQKHCSTFCMSYTRGPVVKGRKYVDKDVIEKFTANPSTCDNAYVRGLIYHQSDF